MALAQIREIRRLRLVERSERLGRVLLDALRSQIARRRSSAVNDPLQIEARGIGLMAGLELRTADGLPATDAALHAIKAMLRRGFILLPEGEHGNVISFTPPLTITAAQLKQAVNELENIFSHGYPPT